METGPGMRQIVLIAAIAALAGCGDPLRGVDRLEDVPLADAEPVAALPDPDQPGLFGRLFGRGSEENDVETTAEVPDGEAASTDVDPGTEVAEASPSEEETLTPAPVLAERGGFLAGLFGGGSQTDRPEREARTPVRATGPDATPAAPGIVLPFGTIATACHMRGENLGRRIASVSGYEIWDTNPGSTAPRTHYITGFDGRCPRQVTAALASFGDIGTHEFVRYIQGNNLPYSDTDNAYETLKAEECGARRGRPCGNRIDRLARDTTFVTLYPRFEGSREWYELLLHDGAVLAVDMEQSG